MTRLDTLFRWSLAGVFVLALALRAGFAWEASALPTARYPVMDAATHLRLAGEIAGGHWLPDQPFYQAPLYPYLLALLERSTGDAAEAARAIQVVASAVTAVLVALAAAAAFGRRAGVASGLLAAAYGPHVVFAPLLLKETLTMAMVAGALVLLLRRFTAGEDQPVPVPGRGRGLGAAAAVGLLLGLGSQLRENLIVLLPIAAIAAATWPAARRSTRAARAAVVLVAGSLTLLPVGWMNARAGGPWFLTSSQSGMNFYIGNVLSDSGTYQPLSPGSQHPEAQREDARRVAARLLADRTGQTTTPENLSDPEVSRIFWRTSQLVIAADPAAWGRRLARKLWLFWGDYEVPDAEGWVVLRELSATLSLAPLTFAPLLGLAAAGLPGAWRRNRRASLLLLALAAATCLSVVAFFVFGRYRLPVILFLLPFAGLAVSEFVAQAAARRFGRLAAGLALVLSVTLLAFASPLSATRRDAFASTLWANLGQAGNRASMASFDRADELSGPARLAEWRLAGDRAAEAALFLRRALAAQPDFFVARIEYAVALQRAARAALLTGDPRQAERWYREALAELAQARSSAPAGVDPDLVGSILDLRATAERGLAAARAAASLPTD